jgi:hypothetical protein
MINGRDMVVAIIAAAITLSIIRAFRSDVMNSSAFAWNSIPVMQTKTGSVRRFFQAPTATRPLVRREHIVDLSRP